MAKKNQKNVATEVVLVSGMDRKQIVECLNRKQSEPANRVLRTVDVMADGNFRKHEPTEEEVVSFIVKHPQYDDMLAKIKEERSKYIQRAERARKAREKVGKNSGSDAENLPQPLVDKDADESIKTEVNAATDGFTGEGTVPSAVGSDEKPDQG